MRDFNDIKVAVAGTGYVGLSIATLLSQHHHVTAVDVIPEKVEKLNNKISPIQDDYIEKYLAEKPLNLVATFHRAGIVGIELVILIFHVVQIVHYLHHLVSASHLEGAYHINTAAEAVNSGVNTCPKHSPFRLRGEP